MVVSSDVLKRSDIAFSMLAIILWALLEQNITVEAGKQQTKLSCLILMCFNTVGSNIGCTIYCIYG